MTTTDRRVHSFVVLWVALILGPVVILLHQEVILLGPHRGWQAASLDSDEMLFSWTRNRLLIWVVLYAAGASLLRTALRKDGGAAALREFAATGPGLIVPPFFAITLMISMVFVAPAEVLLIAMGLGVGFFATWALCSSGRGMADVVGKALLVGTTGMLVLGIAEYVFRLPGVIERTGGSLSARHHLNEQVHGPREAEAARRRALHGQSKPNGTLRILTLGDSFTWGQWVANFDDIWPSQLEQALRGRGYSVQVVNEGVNAGSMKHQASRLRTRGWLFEPDVVVLQYTLNDAGGSPFRNLLNLVPVFGTSLKKTSSLYYPLDSGFQGMQAAWSGETYDQFFTESSPGWNQSQSDIRDIIAQANERNVPVYLLLFPMFDSGLDEGSYGNLAAHHAIERFAKQIDVPFRDIRGDLAAIDPDPQAWWARRFDAHPNAAAHGVAADAVASDLIELGWLGRNLPRAE